jgi:dienelactone hydrolase
MKKSLLLLFVCFLFATMAEAQTRYLAPVYSAAQIQRTDSVRYAVNKTMLYYYFVAGFGKSAPQALLTDIYQPPATDTTKKRPLVIYLHTGNFLPLNAVGPNGGIKDSTAIEFCTRFARLGYVAASADYRLGWNPNLRQEEARRLTLINASYRGIQDVRSCIRFFKANADVYNIDTSKIMLFGEGTGGYLSLGAATLDRFSKIPESAFDANKFFYGGTTMVNENINGNIYGTSFGVVPTASLDTFTKAGDTLCLPNLPTISSNFQMQVNLGGALGDLTWLDASSKPSISFHVPYDFYAPYNNAVLYVGSPTGPQPVIRVQGANLIQRRNDSLGINNAFKGLVAVHDPYKSLFSTRNGGAVQGLFPLFGRDTASDSAPWQFWSPSNPQNANALLAAPSSTPARARTYIDTIMQVVLPRACIVLNLPCKGVVTSTEDLLNGNTTKLFASPNPAKTAITFESEVVNPMQAIQLFDMAGRQVMQVKVNSSSYTLPRNGLPAGMYVAKVKFEGGVLTKKVVFEN